ncbi:hypothetical protein C8A05DRAFT_16475 [Staphylotrichum tortipilum]|uniref:Guanine nucleotide-exchange factor SEC12 n=1 Tax=Staphylotrichum tortipilum TaxID=2831512 RepID=A0AAN6MJQ6_9PEZI|nr:hypothetical protein C8A05DRAFT_16475 [Staphylotrichum longicolle]
MAPAIPSAELRLSYPLYALDFDPQDASRLVVGGGGGAARSGVGNKVSVLDASQPDSLQVVSELELSRDEDSVNTLAVGPISKNTVTFYAGINSAEDELKKGINEHFRVFSAELPSKSKTEPKIAELSRSALFSTTDTEAYQRLLRISGRVGAVATGTIGRSKDAQIVAFDLPAAGTAPKSRGQLELVKEAMDMDMTQISDDEHQLVYCDDYDIYTLIIGKKGTSGPHVVFTIPHDESTGAKARPSFRCIRFLTPTFVLAVANLPKAGGAVLQGFRLPKIANLGKPEKEGRARLALSRKLPTSITRATGLAVRNLSPPATPSAVQGDAQFVVAVTGQDSSITLYTLEHQSMGDVNLIANLYPITTLKEVHLGPISGLAFSHFTPPASTQKPPPDLKLASIGSMGNTCVVHSLPLKRLATPAAATKQGPARGPARPPRYVVALKSHAPSPRNLIIGSALVFALLALLLQGILEVRGATRPVIGARSLTPVSWHRPGTYYALSETQQPGVLSPVPGVADTPGAGGLLAQYRDLAAAAGGEDVIVLHHAGEGEEEEGMVRVEGHDEEKHGRAREWEELHPSQKEAWKERLKKAGHWGEEMGEAVFKGVFFGQIAGVVGAMV